MFDSDVCPLPGLTDPVGNGEPRRESNTETQVCAASVWNGKRRGWAGATCPTHVGTRALRALDMPIVFVCKRCRWARLHRLVSVSARAAHAYTSNAAPAGLGQELTITGRALCARPPPPSPPPPSLSVSPFASLPPSPPLPRPGSSPQT